MDTTFLVTLTLRNPTHVVDEPHYLVGNFVFDKQPKVSDVLAAFCNEPQIAKRHDFQKYYAALCAGLATYGVPVLHQHNLVDPEGFRLAAPRVTARWYMNIVGRTNAESDVEYGSIVVSERMVNKVIDPIADALAIASSEKPPKAKKAKS